MMFFQVNLYYLPLNGIPALKKARIIIADMENLLSRKMNVNRIEQLVHDCYWNHDYNCATTTLLILSEAFSVDLHKQVLDAAAGMHGAGGYGAQCGLVEGALMFIGILGRIRTKADEDIIQLCNSFAAGFENEFGSLKCSRLRPGGFNEEDPPHLCEQLSVKTISWTNNFILENIQ